jgi:hypothetical protein
VHSAQDYSLVVLDPNADAGNPDEWHEYFSRFGKVRYITILRENAAVIKLLTEKHFLARSILHSNASNTSHDSAGGVLGIFESLFCGGISSSSSSRAAARVSAKLKKCLVRLAVVDEDLKKLYRESYAVIRVYVTFETEEFKAACLNDVNIPDFNAIFDIITPNARVLFRGSNVLNIIEPHEPDNILWDNLCVHDTTRQWSKLLGLLMYVAMVAGAYFAIVFTSIEGSIFALSAVVACLDSAMPSLFRFTSRLSYHCSEDTVQSELQVCCVPVLLCRCFCMVIMWSFVKFALWFVLWRRHGASFF